MDAIVRAKLIMRGQSTASLDDMGSTDQEGLLVLMELIEETEYKKLKAAIREGMWGKD